MKKCKIAVTLLMLLIALSFCIACSGDFKCKHNGGSDILCEDAVCDDCGEIYRHATHNWTAAQALRSAQSVAVSMGII